MRTEQRNSTTNEQKAVIPVLVLPAFWRVNGNPYLIINELNRFPLEFILNLIEYGNNKKKESEAKLVK